MLFFLVAFVCEWNVRSFAQEETKPKAQSQKVFKKSPPSKKSSDSQEPSKVPPVPPKKDQANKKAKDKLAEKATEKVASMFFPDWSPPAFDWFIMPIIGFQYQENDSEIGRVHSTTFEGGLGAGLLGIPIVPGNPGLFFAPSASASLGNITSVTTLKGQTDEKSSSQKYQRITGGVDLYGYVRFYRHVLGVSRGRKVFDDEEKTAIQSLTVKNDFGFLVLPWFSSHYTHRYLKAFGHQFSEPFFIENDNWLHGRLFTDILSFYIDAGPGFTLIDEYVMVLDQAGVEPPRNEKTGKGRTDYVLGVSGLHLFWKLGMSARAKYVFKATEEELGSYANTRLPEDSLNTPNHIAMPEDSLSASVFLGASPLFFGVGLGWQYNLQILNYSEKNGKKRDTTSSQGLGASFEMAL